MHIAKLHVSLPGSSLWTKFSQKYNIIKYFGWRNCLEWRLWTFRIPSLLGVSTLMTTFTAITGSLKFTQPGGHVGDEFHPFPLKQSFLTEASGTVAGLHCDFEVFVLFFSVLVHSCVTLKSYFKITDNQQSGCYFDSIVIFHVNNHGWFREKSCLHQPEWQNRPFKLRKLVVDGRNGTRQRPPPWNQPKLWSIWKG